MTIDPQELEKRACALWPDDPVNQDEWLRAWRVLRSTSRGALLDHPAERLDGPFLNTDGVKRHAPTLC